MFLVKAFILLAEHCRSSTVVLCLTWVWKCCELLQDAGTGCWESVTKCPFCCSVFKIQRWFNLLTVHDRDVTHRLFWTLCAWWSFAVKHPLRTGSDACKTRVAHKNTQTAYRFNTFYFSCVCYHPLTLCMMTSQSNQVIFVMWSE